MKWGSEKSLFAVLLRSPWWVSFLVAGGVFAAMRTFFEPMFAAAGGLPFFVIGCVAAWKQLRAPSAKKIASRLAGAADFALERGARLTLVAAKRWKAQRTGVEPLRELAALGETKGAEACWVLCAGELTENARGLARDQAIRVVEGAALVGLVR